MKIGIVTYGLRSSGNEMSIIRLGKWLLGRGHQVEIVTTDKPCEKRHGAGVEGLPILDLAEADSRRSPRHSKAVGVALAKRSYDAVFLNDSRSAQAALGCLSDKTMVCPIVRCDREKDYRQVLVGSELWNVAVGISPKVCERIRSVVKNRPVVCIPNGVEAGLRESNAKPRSSIDDGVKIAYLGRLAAGKGVELLGPILDECVKASIPVTLSVAGEGPLRERMEHSLAAHLDAGRVQFLGWISTGRAYEMLSESHVLLFPSEREGLGNVVIEAGSCGCVPIARRIDGVTTFTIDENQSGYLVDSNDRRGYVSAIKDLHRNPGTWLRMSERARQKSAAFTVESMGEAYEKLMEEWQQGAYPALRSRGSGPLVDRSVFSWRERISSSVRNPRFHFFQKNG